jgi:hypothetical protein
MHPLPLKGSGNGNRKNRPVPADAVDAFAVRRVLALSARAVGERLLQGAKGSWESHSLDGTHDWTRNDLEGTALVVRYVLEFLAKARLPFQVTFENEEAPLLPPMGNGQRLLRLIIDPVDGSKAFDNAMSPADCPVPAPIRPFRLRPFVP